MKTTRHPLTGPILLPAPATSGPAHWWPQYDEPVYRSVYADHRDQLMAGLHDGCIGEVVPPC